MPSFVKENWDLSIVKENWDLSIYYSISIVILKYTQRDEYEYLITFF